MISLPWKTKEPKFFPLPTSPTDEERDDSQFGRPQRWGHVWKLSSVVAGAAGLVLLAGASGYFVGRRTVIGSHDHGIAPPPRKPEAVPCVQASHDVYNEGLLGLSSPPTFDPLTLCLMFSQLPLEIFLRT